MPLAIFKKLGLIPPDKTTIQMLIVDHTLKKIMGISFDVLVRVVNFIFLIDFFILDCEIDFEFLVILG